MDAYAAYNALADSARAGGPVTLAYCWSHVRRRFYEIAQGGNAPIAEAALQRINALYHVEARIRGHAPEQRQAVRQEQSKPVVDDLRTWLDAQLAKVPGRAPIAEAIRYALKLWSGLRLFLDDVRIEIDTNVVERARLRPGRRARCGDVHSDWHRQAQRRRPASLARRRPASPITRPATSPTSSPGTGTPSQPLPAAA